MGGAREMIDKWNQLSVTAKEEMDVKQRREHFLQFVVSPRPFTFNQMVPNFFP